MREYLDMLREVGFTEDQVAFETAIMEDRLDVDLDLLCLALGPSAIEGTGVKAMKPFGATETIGPMNLCGYRTQLGRFTNHSDHPNASPLAVSDGILMIANHEIPVGEEITVDYREMLKLRLQVNDILNEDVALLSHEEINHKIYGAERFLASYPQAEIEPVHVFAFGLYSRCLFIPKNHWITGKVHKQNDLNVVMYGRMRVLSENGFSDVEGPTQFTGKAGIKQLGFAYEDTMWITVHHTHLTNLDDIERELFEDYGEPKVLDFKTGKQIIGALS